MRCPNDSSDLVATDVQGIDVQSCPSCQGIWLEREELDRIIDQAVASQYASDVGDLDTLDDPDDGPRRARRRDKYTEAFDDLDRPRKAKRRKSRRDSYDDVFEY